MTGKVKNKASTSILDGREIGNIPLGVRMYKFAYSKNSVYLHNGFGDGVNLRYCKTVLYSLKDFSI